MILIIFNLIFDLPKIPLNILQNQQIKSRQKVDNGGIYVKIREIFRAFVTESKTGCLLQV